MGQDAGRVLRVVGEQVEKRLLLDRPGLEDDAVEIEGDGAQRRWRSLGVVDHRPPGSDG